MEIQQIHQIRKIIDIAIRRKVLIGMFILIGFAAGLAFYLKQPKIYQAAALLSYQQQRVSPARMSPDEQARIRDIVGTLTQLITSRSSLEQIIVDLNLYPAAAEQMVMENVVAAMQKSILILPSQRGDTFSIAFNGTDQDEVARVANALAARFIEENLKYREDRASETFTYTSSELDMAKEMLDRKESVMRDYKLQYYNEMPEQRATNMARLTSLQDQYQSRQNSIQDLERTRVLIQDQIAVRKQIIEENRRLRLASIAPGPGGTAASAVESDADRLLRFQNELRVLLERYTERHPEVVVLRKRIATLEQAGNTIATQQGQGDQDNSPEQVDRVLADLQSQLRDIGLSIKRLGSEKDSLEALIEQYEEWVAAAPVREAEWSALSREHVELRRHYDYLVAQNLQAGSALNLERKQKGSQFKIEDPARTPLKPIQPNFIRIMGMALLAGAGIGCILAFGRDILDPSLKDPAEVEEFLGVELICTVPQLSLPKEIIRKKLLQTLWGLIFLGTAGSLTVIFVYYWKLGRIVI